MCVCVCMCVHVHVCVSNPVWVMLSGCSSDTNCEWTLITLRYSVSCGSSGSINYHCLFVSLVFDANIFLFMLNTV